MKGEKDRSDDKTRIGSDVLLKKAKEGEFSERKELTDRGDEDGETKETREIETIMKCHYLMLCTDTSSS